MIAPRGTHSTHAMNVCHHIPLGLIDYHRAWDLQHTLAQARARGEIADTLLTLEHPPTYTLGRSGRREHLLLSEEECRRRGVEVIDVDRGGDITYHGPGQLVAYPILYLGQPAPSGRLIQADYIGYLRRLEEVLIRTIAAFGIRARREPGLTGVWIDLPYAPAKIAAIGVRVSAQGISTHGIALNVAPDLSFFGGIIPCGIHDKAVTSIQAILGENMPSMDAVTNAFAAAFGEVFECSLKLTPLESLISTTES